MAAKNGARTGSNGRENNSRNISCDKYGMKIGINNRAGNSPTKFYFSAVLEPKCTFRPY